MYKSMFFIRVSVFPALCILSGLALAQFEEIRVTTNSSAQSMPSVSGNRIVWADSRNGNYDIYLYDIGTSMERSICTMPQAQWYPDIDGSRIVWQDNRLGTNFKQTNDIFMYNLATSSESPVTMAGGFQMYPAISGTRIIWHDTRGTTPPNVYMYDLDDPGEAVIWQDPGSQYSPAISGSRIVCLDDRDGYRNVWLYDLTTETETQITNVNSYKEGLAICGTRMVWSDARHGDNEIYLYDLATSTETRITNDPARQDEPAVSENAIVWTDYRNDPDGDIYLYDLATGQTVPLVTEEHAQNQPDIDGSRVVWTDQRHEQQDIFYLDYELLDGADVQATITDQPDPVRVGEYLIYQLQVLNNGPQTAEGVAGFARLSDAVEFVSAYGTRGTCYFETLEEYPTVICPMYDLEPGWIGEATIVVRPLRAGRISVRGSADAGTDDPIAANNMMTITTRVGEFLSKDLGDGRQPKVRADATGAAHLCYIRDGERWIDHYNPDPMISYPIVHCWDDVVYASNRSGRWQKEIVFDGTGHPDPGMVGNPHYYYEQALYSELALDTDGFVHIAYVVDDIELDVTGATYNQSRRLEYVHNRSGSWSHPIVITSRPIVEEKNTYYEGWGIWSIDIEVDSTGHTHILYMMCYGMAGQGPVIYCTNATGSWTSETLMTAYDRAAMALDDDGFVHLAYYHWDIGGIGYCTNRPEGTWQTPEPVETHWTGGQLEGMVCDIVVDSQGRPHISYVSGQGQPREDYRHAVKEEGVWSNSLVSLGQFMSGQNSIAIGPDDFVHILYWDREEGRSIYANNLSGSWDKQDMGAGAMWAGDIAIDPAGGVHIVRENEDKVYYHGQPGLDADHDGVPDAFEQGPDGSDPDYDGNGDGIPDSQQDDVTSFTTNNEYAYITTACSDGILSNVRPQENPSPPDVPEDWGFLFDFLSFMITDLPIGGSATATLYLPEDAAPQVYYKYGPTAAVPSPHWYPFMYDGQTGAVIEDNVITLHFIDGQRGDNDLLSNGIIIDPGAPGVYQPCLVDLDDLLWFLEEWMMRPPSPALTADFDSDGSVTLSDLARIADLWLGPCPSEWPIRP
ncbi:MAG: hypothetical protein JW828_13240 [Sedimentisphaerales bacterium]|nr:hypothetical protein [Sedimentisphaerales bacterium]